MLAQHLKALVGSALLCGVLLTSGCVDYGDNVDIESDEPVSEVAQAASIWTESVPSGIRVSWIADDQYERIRVCWKKVWSWKNICMAHVEYLTDGPYLANTPYSYDITYGLTGDDKITVYGTPDKGWSLDWTRIGTVD